MSHISTDIYINNLDHLLNEYFINISKFKMRNKGKHFCLPSIYLIFLALIT